MATEDYTAFLSQRDRAKLARNIGVPIGDGRVFKRGVIVSAEDAQRSDMDRQRNSLLTQQTSGYRQSQEMLQREQQRMGQPSPQFLPPMGQAQPEMQPQMPGQPQQAPAGAPSPLLLAQANQIQRYQQANPPQAPVQQPNTGISVAAGPNVSTAPTGLPQGSIGFQRADGSYSVQAPMGPGVGTQTFANEGAARGAFAAAPSPQFLPQPSVQPNTPTALPPQPAPQPSLADKVYSPQEIARMSPEQLMSREAFDQQNVARKQQEAQTALETRKTEAEIASKSAPKTPDAFDVAYTAFKQSNPQATPEQTQKFIDDYRSKGAQQTNVNVGEGLVSKAYSGYEKSRNDIIAADETLSSLDEALSEVASGQAFTGAGAQFRLQGAKVAQLLGSEAFDNEIAATEALASTIAQAALSQIQKLPGPASDKDIKFIERAAAGSSGLPGKKTLERIREIMARSVERNKSRFQQDVDRTFSGEDSNAQFAKRALALGQPQSPQQPAQPQQTQAQPSQPLKIGRFTVIQQ